MELIFSASSATEEKQWKTEIIKSAAALAEAGQAAPPEPRTHFFLSLNLVPLEPLPDQAPSLARRPSINSLAASRSKSDLQEVYIRKTNYPNSTEEAGFQADGQQLGRTKSVQSNRAPAVLAPRRQDRIRLERFISDVYTRDVLPFPGMILAKGDILSRTGSLIRRISFHTGFNRRSSSFSTTCARSIGADTGSIEEEYRRGKNEVFDNNGRGTSLVEFESDAEKKTSTGPPREAMGRTKTLSLKSLCKRTSSSDLATRSIGGIFNGDSQATPKKKWNLLRTALSARDARKLRSKKGSGA